MPLTVSNNKSFGTSTTFEGGIDSSSIISNEEILFNDFLFSCIPVEVSRNHFILYTFIIFCLVNLGIPFTLVHQSGEEVTSLFSSTANVNIVFSDLGSFFRMRVVLFVGVLLSRFHNIILIKSKIIIDVLFDSIIAHQLHQCPELLLFSRSNILSWFQVPFYVWVLQESLKILDTWGKLLIWRIVSVLFQSGVFFIIKG